ncbi:bifunctional allantoicase/(S)-ureidoglycine aminohydrolase [Spiribacter roseus]|uniref:bifunctional allantoicase/(S)-ureidoglycine aminohydrolase n=1 Tax=Spiribacter roseus TaxID=1855875 RepID=UPI001331000B|nr:bifunctional allantoicase/(S)-ureidoglycine aminohydrolase [Spiribacter roseus]KAF0283814.1 (S)-ureidoglycine aminohydrolase [Spiribacter roseus]
MTISPYALPPGGVPDQSGHISGRAVFRTAYAVIPNDVLRDIVTSRLPHWSQTRAWILARPLSGFAETFFQAILEVQPGGGSARPEPDPDGEGAYFVLAGTLEIAYADRTERLGPGGFAWMAPGERYTVTNPGTGPVTFHWIRKAYQPVADIATPASFSAPADSVAPVAMANAEGRWRTTRLIDPDDIAHDMHVNVVSLDPGALIPFAETHVMEHGLYVLEGKAVYRLNEDWVEVEAGDFMWLRAFCPQACYAGGTGPFSYLLYKDVNRHPSLQLR